ncbi:hypothetical protein TRICI_003058 [Trichomonascus ciferrii]|uniref:C2H2-type domain-containing protein n=1 Tax=Trichomonascus ciferrii TaxID=44093 RepID=A0A642VB32_9ASCO|nr:hypothetical protein TRICI_003058 [Trichomonascus ciferrii]
MEGEAQRTENTFDDDRSYSDEDYFYGLPPGTHKNTKLAVDRFMSYLVNGYGHTDTSIAPDKESILGYLGHLSEIRVPDRKGSHRISSGHALSMAWMVAKYCVARYEEQGFQFGKAEFGLLREKVKRLEGENKLDPNNWTPINGVGVIAVHHIVSCHTFQSMLHGCWNWDLVVYERVVMVLYLATGARSGDIALSHGYTEQYYLRWSDVELKLTGEPHLKGDKSSQRGLILNEPARASQPLDILRRIGRAANVKGELTITGLRNEASKTFGSLKKMYHDGNVTDWAAGQDGLQYDHESFNSDDTALYTESMRGDAFKPRVETAKKSEGPTDGQKGSSKIRRERYKERSEAFQQFTSSAAPAPFPSVTEDQQLRKHLEESTSQQSIDKLFEKLRGMQVSEWTQDTMREFDSIVPMSDPYKFSKLMTTINVYSKTELTRAYASNDRKTIAEAIETHCITGNSREPPSILVFTCNGCEFQSADEKAYLKHLEIHKTQQELNHVLNGWGRYRRTDAGDQHDVGGSMFMHLKTDRDYTDEGGNKELGCGGALAMECA